VATVQNHDRCAIQIHFAKGFELKHVISLRLLIRAYLTIIQRTDLAAETWALMAASEIFGTALRTWKAVARCSARHGAATLVLTGPSAVLNAWCTGSVAFFVASRVSTPDLSRLAKTIWNILAAVKKGNEAE
jgi:hypothetical protein